MFRPMFEYSGRAPRAGLDTLAGRIRPVGHTLETPAIHYKNPAAQNYLNYFTSRS